MMETDARFEFVGGVLNRLRVELASARKAKNLHLYRIVQALIRIGEGESVAEVARRFRITCKTACNWIWEFAAGVASFPGARQKIEIVRPSETGALRNDRGGAGEKRLHLRGMELGNDRGHDIFQIWRQFQPALFMRAAGEDRAFVPEG
ncbi:MAG: hypothetical protein WCS96_13880 [Victivallales bacterium]